MNNQGTVMVIDDTLASLKLLTSLLIGEGYQVRPANSGELALASVAANPPELILLDIRMPGLDGFEVIRQLKGQKESREIPVIFLSAVTEVDRRVEGLKMGAVDFISKPFQREELLTRVRTHIDLCRLRKRAEEQAIDLQLANDQLQIEIVERKEAEEEVRQLNVGLEKRVAERTADLKEALVSIEKSLNEKVVMLREIRHRVKNNLQIIISLLNLQSRQFSDPKFGAAIRESQNRIRAISMVHEQIFISNSIENINLGAYIHSLTTNLVLSYKVPTERVHISTTMENITTNIDTAVPLGLIIHELISNALRHAFPNERAGEITITGKDAGGKLEIRVSDNGVGMTPVADPDEAKTIGLKLVHILIEQLDGTVEYTSPPGTTVVLRIPKKEG